MTNSPINTTTQPAITHMPGLIDDQTAYILNQEAAGQQQLLRSTTLPTEMSPDQAAYEALGFTFGDPVPGDPLFREATLPNGWTRVGTDHSMHSDLRDDRGLTRVNIFYKAAFYDRRADMSIVNPAYQIATTLIYGDGPITIDPRLTPDELADLRDSADDYIASHSLFSPHTDKTRRQRAQYVLDLLNLAEKN